MSERNMAVSVLLKARDQLTGSVRAAKRMTDRLNDTVTRIGRNAGFERLRDQVRRTRSAVGGLVSGVGQAAKRLAVIGGGAVTALAGITASVASRGDDIAKFADQTGIGVEALQELQYAYERMGVAEGTLRSSLGAFSKRLGEARKEMGPLYAQLKDSNPELLEQLRNTESLSEALAIYNRAIANAPNQIEKAAMASAAFSRAGLEMVRATRDGVDEIDRLRGRARELGLVLSEESARDAETFADRLTNLKGAFGGLKNIIGGALLPVFSQAMNQLTTLVVSNQQAVRDWAQGFAADLPARIEALKGWVAGLGDTFDRFMDRAQPLIDGVRAVSERFGAMNTAVAGVAAIIAAPILAPLVSLTASLTMLGVTTGGVVLRLLSMAGVGTAVKAGLTAIATGIRVVGAALIANPIGLAIAAIAGAAFLIYKYWGPISKFATKLWGQITGIVGDAWEAITGWLGWDPVDTLRRAWNGVTRYFEDVFGDVKRLVSGDFSALGNLLGRNPLMMLADWAGLGPVIRRAVRAAGRYVADSWNAITGWLGWDPLSVLRPVWNAIAGYIGGVFGAVKKLVGGDISAIGDLFAALNPLNLIRPAFNAARDWLADIDWSGVGTQIIDTLVGGITSAAGRVKDAVVDTIKDAWRGATDAAKGAVDAVGDGINRAKDGVNDAAHRVMSGVRDYLPGSDAKRGPLSDLTASGRALPTTFAGGVMESEKALVSAVDRVMAAANEAVQIPLRRPAMQAKHDERRATSARVVQFPAPMRMPKPTLPGAVAAFDRPRPIEQVTERERTEHKTHTRELRHSERVVERAAPPPIARSNGADAIAAARAGGHSGTGRGSGPHIERIDNRFDVRIEPRDGASAMEIYDEFERRLQGNQAGGWRGVQDVPLEAMG